MISCIVNICNDLYIIINIYWCIYLISGMNPNCSLCFTFYVIRILVYDSFLCANSMMQKRPYESTALPAHPSFNTVFLNDEQEAVLWTCCGTLLTQPNYINFP
jgi:hypothetical protein